MKQFLRVRSCEFGEVTAIFLIIKSRWTLWSTRAVCYR